MPFETIPPGLGTAPPFPDRIVKVGETDKALVRLVQERLNSLGCGPLKVNGVYDKARTERAVRLFQGRFADVTGRPLEVDGKIGSLSWGTMFGADTVPASTRAPSKLIVAVLKFARTQIGVMESPRGSNRGPQVDLYLKSVKLDPKRGSFAWCVAFTYFCFQEAAKQLGVDNPHVRTAGVLDHWNRAKSVSAAKRITHARAIADPALVRPGSLFVMDFGGGAGHTGLVVESANGRLVTIEGNSNDGGSREGIGVFRRQARKIAQINKGFIDYGDSEP